MRMSHALMLVVDVTAEQDESVMLQSRKALRSRVEPIDFKDCSPIDPTCLLTPVIQSLYANLGCPDEAPEFCESVEHAVLVLQGKAVPALEEEQYLLDLLQLLKGYSSAFYSASDKTCDDGDSESCNHKRANFPGPTAQSYLTNGEIRAKMKAVPELQGNGSITRTNMLGFLKVNEKYWFDMPEGERGLGLGGQSVAIHRLVRPIVDRVFGEEGNWSAASIEQQARDFVDSKSQIDMSTDVKIWGQQVLHRVVFGITISEEEAADFGDFQQKALITAILPTFLVTLARSQGVEGLLEKATSYEEVKAKKNQYLAKFWPLTKELHCPLCTDLEVSIVNSNLLDGLVFAGGLSVPGVLLPGIATLYAGDQSPAPGVQLSADNTEQFAWETTRYFPPVLGFSYVDTTKSQPLQIMALGMGQRSADVWGDDAESPTFRMRDMKTYYDNWVGHADFAEDPAGEMTRRCPGKSLSFAMIEGWYKAWDQPAWTPAPGTHFKFTERVPFVNGFTMVRTARSDDLEETCIDSAGVSIQQLDSRMKEDCTHKDFHIWHSDIERAPTYKPDEYTTDEAWRTVKVQEEDGWQSSCVAFVQTGGTSCTDWCGVHGLQCVKGEDDAAGMKSTLRKWFDAGGYDVSQCSLGERWESVKMAGSATYASSHGCDERLNSQVCACSL